MRSRATSAPQVRCLLLRVARLNSARISGQPCAAEAAPPAMFCAPSRAARSPRCSTETRARFSPSATNRNSTSLDAREELACGPSRCPLQHRAVHARRAKVAPRDLVPLARALEPSAARTRFDLRGVELVAREGVGDRPPVSRAARQRARTPARRDIDNHVVVHGLNSRFLLGDTGFTESCEQNSATSGAELTNVPMIGEAPRCERAAIRAGQCVRRIAVPMPAPGDGS